MHVLDCTRVQGHVTFLLWSSAALDWAFIRLPLSCSSSLLWFPYLNCVSCQFSDNPIFNNPGWLVCWLHKICSLCCNGLRKSCAAVTVSNSYQAWEPVLLSQKDITLLVKVSFSLLLGSPPSDLLFLHTLLIRCRVIHSNSQTSLWTLHVLWFYSHASFSSFVIFISFKLKHSKTNQAVISSGLPDFHFRRNSSGVWMRELWQTTPHLWSLDSFSALNSQFWHHHHPQPWLTAKVLSRSVSHTC